MCDPGRYLSFLNNDSSTQERKQLAPGASTRSAIDSGSSRFFAGPSTPNQPFRDSFENDQHVELEEQEAADDDTLDAFDKQLLAERPDERQWQVSQGLARIFLPPKTSTPACSPVLPQEASFGQALRTTPKVNLGFSSSPAAPISSPSVRALKQKEQPAHTGYGKSQNFNHLRPSLEPPQRLEYSSPSATLGSGDPSKRIELKHAPPIIQGIRLVSTHQLPDRFRSIFTFPLFNAVQSKCFKPAFLEDNNLVLSAPTGSGKTAIMELAICRLLHTFQNGQFKVVYQAPTKSLCTERHRDWEKRFAALDLKCAELTGDTDHTHLTSVQTASIIVTTPEKWDSVTRKWKDHIRLMQMVRLFLIDEVHILRESRGATLEAVVSRMKSVGSNVRFVALSATVPNPEDVAVWLGKDSTNQHLPAHRERFSEEFRPVQLQKFVYGYPAKSNDFIFDKILESKLPEIIANHSNGKPTMIFCPTRASCVATAKSLSTLWESTNAPARLWHSPTNVTLVQDPDLRRTLPSGVAFHHAGLDLADRRAVEEGFLAGQISIICATSTLAVGVNLPCYLVIIKNTVAWSGGAMQEYADLEVMQMLGRAGRPQFETSACAVILTRNERVDYYNKMVAGQQRLESCLHLNLIDHLNAEIGLGTVYDLVTARKWLAGTFLFVRLQINPLHYRLQEDLDTEDGNKLLEQICEKDIRLLQEVDLITKADRMKCTEFGDAMARYYIRFETMQIIMSLPPRAKMSEILSAMAQASEFKDAIRFKSGEKSLYKEINKDVGIKFPIKVDIALPAHKVSLLVQAELGGVDFPPNEQVQKHKHAFLTDKNLAFQHVHRLIRCIIDCQLHLGDAVGTRHGLELARSFGAKVWDSSPLQLKQLDQIGNVAVRKLASAGICSIETLESTEPYRIELILGKNPPYGMKLLTRTAEVPKLRVLVKSMGKETRSGKLVNVRFKAEIGFLNEKTPQFFRRKQVFVCFLAEISDGKVIDFRRMSAKNLQRDCEIFLVANLTSSTQFITCSVMCDEIAGTMKQATLRPELPKSLFPPSMKLSKASTGGRRQGNHASSQTKIREIQDENEFSDDGLNDDDLLAAATATDFMDLDDFPDASLELKEEATENAKRKDKQPKRKPQMVPDESWQPTRLGNGKYACKHLCKDKTKCTHQCCNNGLEKPPKRPMKPVTKSESITPSSVPTEETMKQSQKKNNGTRQQGNTPFEKAQAAFQEKRHQHSKPGEQERKSLAKLHQNTGTAGKGLSLSYIKPANSHCGSEQPELSFLGKAERDERDPAEAQGNWDNPTNVNDLMDLGTASKVLGAVDGRLDAPADERRSWEYIEENGFDLSDDGIFDFDPLDAPGQSISSGPTRKQNKDTTQERGKFESSLIKTHDSAESSPRRKQHSFLDLPSKRLDKGCLIDNVPFEENIETSGKILAPQDDEIFLNESSPIKTLPRLGPTSGRTDSSSPFKHVLGSLALRRKLSASNLELDRNDSAIKRRKLTARDLMLESEEDGSDPAALKAVPLSNVTKLKSFNEAKQTQREEGGRKAKEYAEAEMERKKREKEELDRETWGILGPEFEEQFKDVVEFI